VNGRYQLAVPFGQPLASLLPDAQGVRQNSLNVLLFICGSGVSGKSCRQLRQLGGQHRDSSGDYSERREAVGSSGGVAYSHQTVGDRVTPIAMRLQSQKFADNRLDRPDGPLHLAVCTTIPNRALTHYNPQSTALCPELSFPFTAVVTSHKCWLPPACNHLGPKPTSRHKSMFGA